MKACRFFVSCFRFGMEQNISSSYFIIRYIYTFTVFEDGSNDFLCGKKNVLQKTNNCTKLYKKNCINL